MVDKRVLGTRSARSAGSSPVASNAQQSTDYLPIAMPQLEPFYFINQLSFTLAGLFVLTAILGQYVLPALLELQVARAYVGRL
jgi:hypothetical protein